ncbi:cupin fold metalloprotein, WbuC family [Aliidiomarina halalkaliphila]|uniref:Cupin fold metalloprotein, WbuC family n=1 Tax=Aliidiomarina halalkaliphila TaxID=2593535 RepID=A0A552X5E4_9GAMM|nr:WbuC family cupin fold metalloprotein [Aliidiomarina halalkaliphila]TRW50186.1 cupin fold metalloprotein, WbuC family [Aliidiomarina halalkaliphila]
MENPLFRTFSDVSWQALKCKASDSSRLRAHFNLHRSYNDAIQKTLICILKGSYIPPHFHRHAHQKELFVVLQGKVKVIFFERNGVIRDNVFLEQGGFIEITPYSIHSVVCLSEFANVLEIKSGPFTESDSKEFLEWTIEEGEEQADRYLAWLESASAGERFGEI